MVRGCDKHRKATCFDCRFTWSGDPVFIVSKQAMAERARRWVEIPGVAAGEAVVHHKDWRDIADRLDIWSTPFRGRNIAVWSEDGSRSFYGVIVTYEDKRIHLAA